MSRTQKSTGAYTCRLEGPLKVNHRPPFFLLPPNSPHGCFDHELGDPLLWDPAVPQKREKPCFTVAQCSVNVPSGCGPGLGVVKMTCR